MTEQNLITFKQEGGFYACQLSEDMTPSLPAACIWLMIGAADDEWGVNEDTIWKLLGDLRGVPRPPRGDASELSEQRIVNR